MGPDCPENSFCGTLSSKNYEFTQSLLKNAPQRFFLENQCKDPSILAHSEWAKIDGSLHWTGQDRTGRDRTGQERTGQDRTRQERAGQDRKGSHSTGEGVTVQGR